MMVRETDRALRRIERNTLIVCIACAVCAWVLSGGQFAAPLGVLAGGALIGMSYWTIKGGVDALSGRLTASRVPPEALAQQAPLRPGRLVAWTVAKFMGRYALLGIVAYVMIARLRLHPIGLLAGVSSVAAAVAIESLRMLVSWRASS